MILRILINFQQEVVLYLLYTLHFQHPVHIGHLISAMATEADSAAAVQDGTTAEQSHAQSTTPQPQYLGMLHCNLLLVSAEI